MYLATGQDAGHIVEGSLADTRAEPWGDGIRLEIRIPAILVGVHGGGTELPAQAQCRALLLKNKTGLPAKKQLAESIAAAVLAGEISLLAAQANHDLAKAHQKLAR
jgi:hydroxymethylglutaryl-CoA reductase (NADPH)